MPWTGKILLVYESKSTCLADYRAFGLGKAVIDKIFGNMWW